MFLPGLLNEPALTIAEVGTVEAAGLDVEAIVIQRLAFISSSPKQSFGDVDT